MREEKINKLRGGSSVSVLAQCRPLRRPHVLLFFLHFRLNVDYFSNLQTFIHCAELKRMLFFFCQPKYKDFFPANKTSKMPQGGKTEREGCVSSTEMKTMDALKQHCSSLLRTQVKTGDKNFNSYVHIPCLPLYQQGSL